MLRECPVCLERYEEKSTGVISSHQCRTFIAPEKELKKTFSELGQEIGALVEEKNKAYGDSFSKSGDILRILYPNGIRPEQYDDALCLVRIIDKMFRVATDKDALGESPFFDISGYGILGYAKDLASRKS